MLCRFAFLIFSHESLLIRLLVRCLDMLFPVRTPLHNLFAFVHPKVVSVFSKLSSQRFNGYYNFCYHISPFFVLLRIESVVSSRPFRDHPERHAYMRDPFSNDGAKIRWTFYFFQIFSQLFYIICYLFWNPMSKIHKFTNSHKFVSSYFAHNKYIIYNIIILLWRFFQLSPMRESVNLWTILFHFSS